MMAPSTPAEAHSPTSPRPNDRVVAGPEKNLGLAPGGGRRGVIFHFVQNA